MPGENTKDNASQERQKYLLALCLTSLPGGGSEIFGSRSSCFAFSTGAAHESCDVSEQPVLNLLHTEPWDVVRFFTGGTSLFKDPTIKTKIPLQPLMPVLIV